MTQEEKDLLLKDLCARLPYGIIASVRGSDEEFQYFHILGVKDGKVWVKNDMLCVDDFDDVEVVKPYLRPMSSMTEEEKSWYESLRNALIYQENGEYDLDDFNELNDFLNRRKLDRYDLIGMGIALEAPEGMYK